eukprot:3828527-Amphidinium_carterae.1
MSLQDDGLIVAVWTAFSQELMDAWCSSSGRVAYIIPLDAPQPAKVIEAGRQELQGQVDPTSEALLEWLDNSDCKSAVEAVASHPRAFFRGFEQAVGTLGLRADPANSGRLIDHAFREGANLQKHSADGLDALDAILRRDISTGDYPKLREVGILRKGPGSSDRIV